jgi:DNA-binding response OmpR family regulator
VPPRKTILIVEDEETLRSLTKDVLTREGYVVLEANNGAEGLKRFTAEHRGIDLVLLDLGLPLVAGDTLFRQLRAIDPRVPIVLSTGFLRKDPADDTLRKNASAVIQKPFAVDELLATIRQVFSVAEGWLPRIPGAGTIPEA